MATGSKTFTYTAQRGAYLSIVAAFTFLIIIEGGVLGLLIAVFAPAGLIRLALLGAMIGLYLLLFAMMLSPLTTRHRLDASHLHLRYGFDVRADVPRTAITTAEPTHEKVTTWQAMRAQYDADRQRVKAAFSEEGQVLLRLDRPRPFRVGPFGGGPAAEILINLDDREAFLAAIGLPTTEDTETRGQGDKEILRQTDTPVVTPSPPHLVSPSLPLPLPSSAAGIRTQGLTRHYDGLIAVDDLSLAIRSGEVYGFLGPNGAGKTTTIKMLVGLLEPNAGHAWIAGHDIWTEPLPAKTALGYVADRAMLYARLTGREFLAFLAQMRGIPREQADERIQDLLSLLELSDRADSPCGKYSFGMKRKLALAGALLHRPPVLILDEPLSGLDPRSARRLKDLFAELAAGGATIFLSTHDLATAESVCHRVGIIHKGRLLTEGSAHDLRKLAAAPSLESVFLTLTAEQEEEPT
ncbi:MAG: ABC transporter ATP-binding protein [Anaerolineae bacterium]